MRGRGAKDAPGLFCRTAGAHGALCRSARAPGVAKLRDDSGAWRLRRDVRARQALLHVADGAEKLVACRGLLVSRERLELTRLLEQRLEHGDGLLELLGRQRVGAL